jgi:hypothetical protein
MNTFYANYDLCDSQDTINLSSILALPYPIDECELEIEYSISQFVPQSFYAPAEGGEIEDCNIKVVLINGSPCTKKQSDKLLDILYSDTRKHGFIEITSEWCYEDQSSQNESYQQDRAEYLMDI